MPHVGATPPLLVAGIPPSGASICQAKTGLACKPSKMAEALRRVRASARRQMVAERARGPDSHSAHGSHRMSKHTLIHTHTQRSRSASLALTDDGVAPPGEPRAPARCVSMVGGKPVFPLVVYAAVFAEASKEAAVCRK